MARKYTQADVLNVLKAGKARISDRNNWVRGYWSKKKNKKELEAGGNYMYAHCATGAIGSAARAMHMNGIRQRAVNVLREQLPDDFDSVEGFNDTRVDGPDGHKEVIELFDRGIAYVEAQIADQEEADGR